MEVELVESRNRKKSAQQNLDKYLEDMRIEREAFQSRETLHVHMKRNEEGHSGAGLNVGNATATASASGSNQVDVTDVPSCSGSNTAQGSTYVIKRVVGRGTFGIVYLAQCVETGDTLAIKKILHDNHFSDREVEIQRHLCHPNIVQLKDWFLTSANSREQFSNLVMEYMPYTLQTIMDQYVKVLMPLIYVKLYTYQIFRSLAYLHKGFGVVHRDIKPENFLIDPSTHQVKLCDFGNAKVLRRGEKNKPYICSRPYRAPELILGSCFYSTSIDMWSVGCIMAELLLGRSLFIGKSIANDPMMDIMMVLGSPSRTEIRSMNPRVNVSLTTIRGMAWNELFARPRSQQAVDLVTRLLQYSPDIRLSAIEACAHPFFDDIRDGSCLLPDGHPLPPLFDFTPEELKDLPVGFVDSLLPRPRVYEERPLAPRGEIEEIDEVEYVPSVQEMEIVPETMENKVDDKALAVVSKRFMKLAWRVACCYRPSE